MAPRRAYLELVLHPTIIIVCAVIAETEINSSKLSGLWVVECIVG